jgi:predicted dehydrogenase
MLAPTALVRTAPPEFDEQALSSLAAALAAEANAIPDLLGQSYLYSDMEPPAQLAALLDDALADPSPRRAVPILEPPADDEPGTAEITLDASISPSSAPPLAVLGAGDYVRIEVAPALARSGLRRAILADREPQIAALAAAELSFERASTDAAAAIDALDRRGLVVVATAHDSHAALSARALAAGHRVLCEKPAVVTAADLDLLTEAAAAHPGELEIGFNRRHNPLVERARRELARESGPATIVASIREVEITPDHWYLWPNQGTRVAGNLCHWIDLAMHLLDDGLRAVRVSVSPRVVDGPEGLDAERAFSIALEDGSTIVLVPSGRGDSIRGVQEQIEARRGRTTLRLDDLWRLVGTRAGRPIRGRIPWRDKGHAAMYRRALERFAQSLPTTYPVADIARVGEIQIAMAELIRAGEDAGDVDALFERSRLRERPPAST